MSWNPTIRFVPWPGSLPKARRMGRVVLVDLAFAYGERFESTTRPFIEQAGEDLRMWIDHHPHEAWPRYAGDPRFVLVDKRDAPACPELVTEERAELMKRDGVETVLAHGDFDGCLSAVKVVLEGREPYPGADEDARAIDAPGRGFRCSERGDRLAQAFAYASHACSMSDYVELLERSAMALIRGDAPGRESGGLAAELDAYAQSERDLFERIRPQLERATQPHPSLIVLRFEDGIARSVKKALLQELETRAVVALIDEAGFITAATFHDLDVGLDTLPGLHG
ncbi:MAG: hypothetical protein AAF658_20595, partial [Myxococcota bacterium]